MKFVMLVFKRHSVKRSLHLAAILALCGLSFAAFAADDEFVKGTFAEVAYNVIAVFSIVTKAIVGAAYVAGVGFAVGAIMKFKQHKDNPTQIPIGTPIALLFIATAMVALPTIIEYTRGTLFGEATKGTPEGYPFWKEGAGGSQ